MCRLCLSARHWPWGAGDGGGLVQVWTTPCGMVQEVVWCRRWCGAGGGVVQEVVWCRVGMVEVKVEVKHLVYGAPGQVEHIARLQHSLQDRLPYLRRG